MVGASRELEAPHREEFENPFVRNYLELNWKIATNGPKTGSVG